MKNNILKSFLNCTFFSILGTLGVSCYILADTYFISKGLGTDGLTALNLAIPVFNFIFGVGMMLGMGGGAKFSVAQSRGDGLSDVIYVSTLFMSLISSVLFVFAGVFFSEEIARLLGASEIVLDMTVTYLKMLLYFSPAFILNNVLLCYVRNDNGERLSMLAMLVGSFSNIILDYIFIFPLDMGMFGAILATCLSPVISIACMSYHWFLKKNSFKLTKSGIKGKISMDIILLGLPNLVSQVSSGIVMIIFNILIMKLCGSTGVAAYGVVVNIALVVIALYNGIAQGVQPLISRFHGMGNRADVKRVYDYSLAMMAIFSVILYALIFVYAEEISMIFNTERNPVLQEIAVFGLKIYFISSIFAGYNIILSTLFASEENPFPAQIISLLRGFVIIIPCVFLMSNLWGMTGIWLVYPVSEGLTAVIGYNFKLFPKNFR